MRLERRQRETLCALAGKVPHYYLVGGTALSLFYFQHRVSLDLDLFTQRFDRFEIQSIVDDLKGVLKKPIPLHTEQTGGKFIQMMMFHVLFGKKTVLKVDFVQDPFPLLKPVKVVDQIAIASLEDIFFRKILAVSGTFQAKDVIGRIKPIGGREEAKDFYDLYCLSHTFMRLSDFALMYCDPSALEAMIRWFRTFDRLEMKTGLLALKVKRALDLRQMERHFNQETSRLITAL